MDTKSIIDSIKDVGLMILASIGSGFLAVLALMMFYKAEQIANDTALDLPAGGVTVIEGVITTLSGVIVALAGLISLSTGLAAIVILFKAFFGKKNVMEIGGKRM